MSDPRALLAQECFHHPYPASTGPILTTNIIYRLKRLTPAHPVGSLSSVDEQRSSKMPPIYTNKPQMLSASRVKDPRPVRLLRRQLLFNVSSTNPTMLPTH